MVEKKRNMLNEKTIKYKNKNILLKDKELK